MNRFNKTSGMVIIAALTLCLAGAAFAKCDYCGSTSMGSGCSYGPNKVHRHSDAPPEKCIYCGSTSYGSGCSYSPYKVHEHQGTGRCRYCNSKSLGSGCSYSPTKHHVR